MTETQKFILSKIVTAAIVFAKSIFDAIFA